MTGRRWQIGVIAPIGPVRMTAYSSSAAGYFDPAGNRQVRATTPHFGGRCHGASLRSPAPMACSCQCIGKAVVVWSLLLDVAMWAPDCGRIGHLLCPRCFLVEARG
jgi:hypothetical protein